MRFVTVRELNRQTAKVVDAARTEGVILTRWGKPVAIMSRYNPETMAGGDDGAYWDEA